jgi:hypothetical protein
MLQSSTEVSAHSIKSKIFLHVPYCRLRLLVLNSCVNGLSVTGTENKLPNQKYILPKFETFTVVVSYALEVVIAYLYLIVNVLAIWHKPAIGFCKLLCFCTNQLKQKKDDDNLNFTYISIVIAK